MKQKLSQLQATKFFCVSIPESQNLRCSLQPLWSSLCISCFESRAPSSLFPGVPMCFSATHWCSCQPDSSSARVMFMWHSSPTTVAFWFAVNTSSRQSTHTYKSIVYMFLTLTAWYRWIGLHVRSLSAYIAITACGIAVASHTHQYLLCVESIFSLFWDVNNRTPNVHVLESL